MKPRTIAIDGPAGSGKSTVGEALADRLGYSMLDTGIIYRLITRHVLGRCAGSIEVGQIEAVVDDICTSVSIRSDGSGSVLELNGHPLTKFDLHAPDVNHNVPHIAKLPEVRSAVRRVQRSIIDRGPSIVAGRDIGTVVAPEADLKLFLDVSLKERAARRMWARGYSSKESQDDIARELEDRDGIDKTRAASPMRISRDALVFRSDRLSLDETVQMIIDMCDLERVVDNNSSVHP
jgi:cytidylate kinase